MLLSHCFPAPFFLVSCSILPAFLFHSSCFHAPFFLLSYSILPGFLLPSAWFPAPFLTFSDFLLPSLFPRFLISCYLLPVSWFHASFSLFLDFLLLFPRFLISCYLRFVSWFHASFSMVFLHDLPCFLVSCFLLPGFSAWFTLFPGFYPFSPLPFLHTHSYLSTPFLVLISWSDLTYSVVQSGSARIWRRVVGRGRGGLL